MTVSKTPHMTDYEAERRNFHLEVPAQFNFAIDVIGKWAADPSKPAMLWIGEHGEEKGERKIAARTAIDQKAGVEGQQ